MQSPDVSVIIPCYNRKTIIGNAIESILNQEFSGTIEIIVSDDGSTDGSVDYVQQNYSNQVRILKKPLSCTQQGASGARNRGLRVANGEFICFLDSDDYYLKGYVQALYNVLKANQNLGYAYCRVIQSVKNDSGVTLSMWTKRKMKYLDRRYHVAIGAHRIWTGCIMCRKKVLDIVGFFNEKFRVAEDTDMWLRISEVSLGQFVDVSECVYCIDGFQSNQLTKLSSSLKNDDGITVVNQAISRNLKDASCDKLHLFFLYRTFYMLTSNQSTDLFSRIRRNVSVYIRLLLKMPKTMLLFLFSLLKK